MYAALIAIVLAGCGNYSNQDLEFMSALPSDSELQAQIPARSAGLSTQEAELALQTHNVTTVFNGIVSSLTNLVDAIRSFSPTSRTPDSRIWGPYPADDHPGWQARMIVTRETDGFAYEIAFHREGGPDTAWPVLLSGMFQADRTARRGTGSFDLVTAELRAAGFDPKLDRLDHLHVDYQTGGDPVTIHMDVTNLPNLDPTRPDDPTSAVYAYKALATGRGQMTFDLTGNFIIGPALDTVSVTSDWLPSGEGMASARVTAGDGGVGLVHTECWDRLFQATYNDKPWAPVENVGDPSACPAITPLP